MRILLLFFLLLSFGASAHSDMVMSLSKENIHMEYKTGWLEFEIGNRFSILLDLSAKLVKEKKYTDQPIYIYFHHDYTKRHPPQYYLGYGTFSHWDYEQRSSKKVEETGLTLFIRDQDIDIKKLLNLIRCAFENISAIKENQSLLPDETYYSISADTIQKYLASSDSVVDRLIQGKTYRHSKPTEKSGDIDYYYQNNQYHFYNSKQWGKTDVGDKLVVDHILEIFGSHNDGHFVFINDSIFYYLPMYDDKACGPFKIDSIHAGRPPIRKYDHEYSPVNRFILFIDNYESYSKAAFFPDSNLVISNFDKLENDFIKGIFETQTTKQIADSNMKLYLILIVLSLSIGLNVWLWLKRSKLS